jgi:DNA-directed RNA polymerase sigma subunit (sigma70/sigma32)
MQIHDSHATDDDDLGTTPRPLPPTRPRVGRTGRTMPPSFRALCWAMVPGNAARFLTAEEERAVVVHYQQNGCARSAHRIVEAFSAWLFSRAIDVLGAEAVAAGDGFPEATCALLDAAERWDSNAGARLASYATPYVAGALLRLTMVKGPLAIGTSSDERKAFFGHARAKKAFVDIHGRKPTPADDAVVADLIGCSGATLQRVNTWKAARIVPIDPDLEGVDHVSQAERAVLQRTIVQAIGSLRPSLKPRDKAILDASIANVLEHDDARFPAPSAVDLAQRFGCTPRRIRQIRDGLFGQLRVHLEHKGIRGLHDALVC